MFLALPPPGTQTEPWATHSTSWPQSPHLCHEGGPDNPYDLHSPKATEATISSYPALYTTSIFFSPPLVWNKVGTACRVVFHKH